MKREKKLIIIVLILVIIIYLNPFYWGMNSKVKKQPDLSRIEKVIIDSLNDKYSFQIERFYHNFNSKGGDIKLDGTFDRLSGYSETGQKTTLLFAGYDPNATTAHEVMHSMGLDHSFESKDIIGVGRTTTDAPNGKYTFQAKTTDNIMDYSHSATVPIDRKSIMEWQWEILQRDSQPDS